VPTKRKSSARRPAKARRKLAAQTKRPARPQLRVAEVYRARQRMRGKIAKDRANNYRKFLNEIKNPTEPPGPEMALRSLVLAPGKQNLRILAEGDSWFEYPLPITHGDGVIYQLQKLLGYGIGNMAHHGLEAEQMLGLSMRQEIISRLTDPQVKFDALLFSGGGNDIAGDQFCIWLKDAPPPVPPPEMINTNALAAALAILEAEFRELIDIRNQYSRQTVIFVNQYDFPPITGLGVCGAGPWLQPSLDYAYKHTGVTKPDPKEEFVVVKTIMQSFSTMLNRVAADPNVQRFVVVPTQGTLDPNASDWQNEIHPSSAGFRKIAQKFQTALASVFP
jgi:hypothetical protein